MRIEPFSFKALGSNGAFEPMPIATKLMDASPQIVEQTYTQQDLTASEGNGFVKGYNEGMSAGMAQMQAEQREREGAMLAATQVMVRRIEEMVVQHQDFLAQQAEHMGKLTLSIARKVAGDAIEARPEPMIERLVMDCLNTFLGQPRFAIYVHSTLVEPIQQRITQQTGARGITTEILLKPDDAIAPGDCRIEWKNGEAQRNSADIWQEIEALIQARPAAVTQSTEHELLHGAARLPGHDETNTHLS